MQVLNLDSSFTPYPFGKPISFEAFQFSGGEPHIKIQPFDHSEEVTITHRVQSFNDFGLVLLSIDALRRMGTLRIRLVLPYFPGARQDRVMIPGEPLTVKVYAELLNQLKLDEVIVLDPHSEITSTSINQVKVISNFEFIQSVISEIGPVTLVAPDAGAAKKIYQLGNQLNVSEIITCSKIRAIKTGKLSNFKVNAEDLAQKDLLLVDDICDGGGTFIGLAQELKKKNAGKIYLAVTHGIFSKGIAELNSLFETIFTTNSFRRNSNEGLIIKTIKL